MISYVDLLFLSIFLFGFFTATWIWWIHKDRRWTQDQQDIWTRLLELNTRILELKKRPVGRWILDEVLDGDEGPIHIYECSECKGQEEDGRTPFCRWCGAIMGVFE